MHSVGWKGHRNDRCWYAIGYPKWHSKFGQTPVNPDANPRVKTQPPTRWNSAPRTGSPKTAAVAQVGAESSSLFTPQQLAQLAQLMPQLAKQQLGSDTDDELEQPFSGMMSINHSKAEFLDSWIIDSGATDHMTPDFHHLLQPVPINTAPEINLPNGATTHISHLGTVKLNTGLVLKNVLCVPSFYNKLLSVRRLISDNNCQIQFYGTHCVILDNETKELKGVGKAHQGLYYLIDHISGNVPESWLNASPQKVFVPDLTNSSCSSVASVDSHFTEASELGKWHHRLGHASAAKLKFIPCVQPFLNLPTKVCVTCPMSKFNKLPFPLSDSHAQKAFDLIHIDIWGPYRVYTRGKYKHFLTIVDDHTRHTCVYLLQYKSDALTALQTFLQYAQNQFRGDVKIIRSDNALEFDDVA